MAKKLAIIRRIDGEVDDVAISGDLFRLEQMADDSWWVCIYRGKKQVAFALHWDKKRKGIIATVTNDMLGCEDDSTREHTIADWEREPGIVRQAMEAGNV